MKIVFISNYFTHHQQPFCDAMYHRLGGSFCFIATVPMEEERKKMGWDMNGLNAYVIDVGSNMELQKEAQNKLRECDVLMLGACSVEWMDAALQSPAKVIFQYSERLFKSGFIHAFGPGAFRYRLRYHKSLKNRNSYMLCASAYLPVDLRLLGVYKNRCYRWGYFPETKCYQDISQLIQGKKVASILWTGRMIDWKHPEDAVILAHKLKQSGIPYSMCMIGEGTIRPQIQEQIIRLGLQDDIQLLDFVAPGAVREKMERADIYLVTSDQNEGWGAVLNESMNAACAVVASRAIGSAPYLINEGANGLLYDRNKENDLFEKVKMLLYDVDKKHSLQYKAYETMISEWNAATAADRLLSLSENLQNGKATEYQSGPCSKAKVIMG